MKLGMFRVKNPAAKAVSSSGREEADTLDGLLIRGIELEVCFLSDFPVGIAHERGECGLRERLSAFRHFYGSEIDVDVRENGEGFGGSLIALGLEGEQPLLGGREDVRLEEICDNKKRILLSSGISTLTFDRNPDSSVDEYSKNAKLSVFFLISSPEAPENIFFINSSIIFTSTLWYLIRISFSGWVIVSFRAKSTNCVRSLYDWENDFRREKYS